MLTQILKVISQSETFMISKADGTQMQKSVIVLQSPGGKYEDSYAAVLLGAQAAERYEAGSLVVASLSFRHREHNGQVYQDITAQELQRLG